MLFLGVGQNPLNGFFAQGIYLLAALGFAQLLSQIKILLPNMSGKQALPLFTGAAGLPAGTALAYPGYTVVRPPSILTGGMSQILALWANKAVILQVIDEIPWSKFVFPAFVTGTWLPSKVFLAIQGVL